MSYPAWMAFPCFKSGGNSIFSFLHYFSSYVFPGMQIGRRVSFQLMGKDFLVRKPYGQIGGIMDIARFHQSSWQKCKKLY